jgi:hypothetical protein
MNLHPGKQHSQALHTPLNPSQHHHHDDKPTSSHKGIDRPQVSINAQALNHGGYQQEPRQLHVRPSHKPTADNRYSQSAAEDRLNQSPNKTRSSNLQHIDHTSEGVLDTNLAQHSKAHFIDLRKDAYTNDEKDPYATKKESSSPQVSLHDKIVPEVKENHTQETSASYESPIDEDKEHTGLDVATYHRKDVTESSIAPHTLLKALEHGRIPDEFYTAIPDGGMSLTACKFSTLEENRDIQYASITNVYDDCSNDLYLNVFRGCLLSCWS